MECTCKDNEKYNYVFFYCPLERIVWSVSKWFKVVGLSPYKDNIAINFYKKHIKGKKTLCDFMRIDLDKEYNIGDKVYLIYNTHYLFDRDDKYFKKSIQFSMFKDRVVKPITYVVNTIEEARTKLKEVKKLYDESKDIHIIKEEIDYFKANNDDIWIIQELVINKSYLPRITVGPIDGLGDRPALQGKIDEVIICDYDFQAHNMAQNIKVDIKEYFNKQVLVLYKEKQK